MLSYTMVGTNDLDRALAFYHPILTRLGMAECYADDACVSFGDPADPMVPRFFVGRPFDGAAASAGNGAMTAFFTEAAETVDALHALALDKGGRCDGPPGPRPQYGETLYGAYVRDPDENKLAFARF